MRDVAGFLGKGAVVFAVLAWLSLAVQVGLGLFVLVMGGPPVPIGDLDIPARLIGILNIGGAVIYWFLFMFVSKLTRLLLAVHAQVTKT